MGRAASKEYCSALDFETEEELKQSLQASLTLSEAQQPSSPAIAAVPDADDTSVSHDSSSSSSMSCNDDSAPKFDCGWMLRNYNPKTTFLSSVEHETKRLSVLKSYQVLESDREPVLDKLTSEMRRKFDVPWAVLSLVDYGRQWFMSIDQDNLGVQQTSRQVAFCAHTIQDKSGLLVVPHALEDERFKDNPLVQGGPNIRFYAGASLVSPEGYNLGALCVLDTKPRPGGLTKSEQELLKSQAACAVKFLVDRRKKLTVSRTSKLTPVDAAAQAAAADDTKRERASSFYSPTTFTRISMGEGHKKQRQHSQVNVLDDADLLAPDISLAGTAVIPRPEVLRTPVPDPKTTEADPDQYLAMLIESQTGQKLRIKPALELGDGFFPKFTDEQIAAYNMEIVCAARTNDVAKLRELFQRRGRDCLDCYNRFGEGLLNMACRRGFKEMAEFLLSDEVKLSVRICDDYGRTPLHDACWYPSPQLEIVSWIMNDDPSLFLIKDKRGFTPFQYARKSDWQVWRQFLFDNRDKLNQLVQQPDIITRFS